MKTMQDFADRQLSKRQMNQITGGQGIVECIGKQYKLECEIVDANGIRRRIYTCGETNGEAIFNAGKEGVRLGATVSSENCTWF